MPLMVAPPLSWATAVNPESSSAKRRQRAFFRIRSSVQGTCFNSVAGAFWRLVFSERAQKNFAGLCRSHSLPFDA